MIDPYLVRVTGNPTENEEFVPDELALFYLSPERAFENLTEASSKAKNAGGVG